MSEDTSKSERKIDYEPYWNENQRRGYRAYLTAKNEGKGEQEALGIAFEHAQPSMDEYKANDGSDEQVSRFSVDALVIGTEIYE